MGVQLQPDREEKVKVRRLHTGRRGGGENQKGENSPQRPKVCEWVPGPRSLRTVLQNGPKHSRWRAVLETALASQRRSFPAKLPPAHQDLGTSVLSAQSTDLDREGR